MVEEKKKEWFMIRKETMILKNTHPIDEVYKREKKVSPMDSTVILEVNWKRNLR